MNAGTIMNDAGERERGTLRRCKGHAQQGRFRGKTEEGN